MRTSAPLPLIGFVIFLLLQVKLAKGQFDPNFILINGMGRLQPDSYSYITCVSDDSYGKIIFNRVLDQGDGMSLPKSSLEYTIGEPQFYRTLNMPSADNHRRVGAYDCSIEKNNVPTGIVTLKLPPANLVELDAVFPYLTANAGDIVDLEVQTTRLPTLPVRWLKDGQPVPGWDGQLSVRLQRAKREDGGVYECFYEGMRERRVHAFIRLIVRGCPSELYGDSCDKECPPCYNGGVCHDKWGVCVCPGGFSGTNCEIACASDHFGAECDKLCSSYFLIDDDSCAKVLFCKPDPYGCSCAPGFKGSNCTESCEPGWYGADCKQPCHCADGVSNCNRFTGVCAGGCARGWRGHSCQIGDYQKKRSVVQVTAETQADNNVTMRESVLGDRSSKRKLVNWFVGRRKNGTDTNKWRHDLPRIAVALFLAEKDFFKAGNRTMEEMNYELTIRLLSQMARGGDLRRRDLSLYIHALIVACVDPRNFHGRDLVSELRTLVEATNGTVVSPFELLVLCNAGDAMSNQDAERIATIFDSQHRPFWTDNQVMATLALACVSARAGVTVDERTLLDMAQELKKRQFRNGTVDNLKTTALVVQALIATHSLERDFDLSAAIGVLLRAQKEDGSVGSLLDSYYVLPVLSNSSLLNVTSDHCKRPTITESEALRELRGSRGRRVSTQFSVWIGTEVDLRRTWTIKVPADSSLYSILETVQKLDSRQQVEYNVIDGKPYVSSLMGIQDDVETGFYWFTYLRTQGTEDTKLVEESPVDVKIRANQELILWYKSGQWNKQITPET